MTGSTSEKLKGAVFAPFHFALIGPVRFAIVLLQVFGIASLGFAATPISGFNPATLGNKQTSVFFDVNTFTGNNAFPLEAIYFDKGWDGSFTPAHTNYLDIYWKADAGAVYRGWRLAAFHRGELFAQANRDTVEILRLINREEDLPVGRDFNIDLDAKGFSASGLELSKGFRIAMPWLKNGMLIGFTARYMKGEKIQEATIRGVATPTSSRAYDFNLQVDYAYDQDVLYRRRDMMSPTGDGYSLDIGLQYDFSKNISAAVLFRDILGRIYWKDVPYTLADATSATKHYSKDGYMEFRPIIHGYESHKSLTQKIPLKTDIMVEVKHGAFTVTPTVNFIEDRPLYWIDVKHKVTPNFSYDFGYNINYQAVMAGVAYKRAVFRMYADNFSMHDLKSLGLMMSAGYQW
jgi:hypothetical protein